MILLSLDNLSHVEKFLVDAGYSGERFANQVKDICGAQVEVVKRSELHKFVVLPRRWVVERLFGWLDKFRRLWKNCERKLFISAQILISALRHDPELLGCAFAPAGAVGAVRWAVKPEGAVLLFAQCPYDKVLGASNLPMLRYESVPMVISMLSSPLYRPRLALLLGETMEVLSARSSDRRGRSVTA